MFEHGCGPGEGRKASNYPRVRRKVGNAVPPPAAEVIVGAVAEVLERAGVPARTARDLAAARRGRLTLSAGLRC